jgi:NTP pyrophosphatase (non-canonical NTP hydrolase)
MEINSKTYQFLAAQFDTDDHRHYDTLYDGLREEIHELIQHSDNENFIEEVGDVLWYLSTLCKDKGFTLEDAMMNNINKLEMRKLNGKG